MSENHERSGARLFAGAGMWAWYAGSDCVFADATTARLFGVDPAEAATGVPLVKMNRAVHPGDANRVERAIARSLEGDPVRIQYRLRHDSYGEKVVVSAWQTFLTEAGDPMLSPGFVVDVTNTVATDLDLLDAHILEMRTIAERWNLQPVSYLLGALHLETEQLRRRLTPRPN